MTPKRGKTFTARNAIALLALLTIVIVYLNCVGYRETPHDPGMSEVQEHVAGLDSAIPRIDHSPWAKVADFASLPPGEHRFEGTDRWIDPVTGVEFSL